jgi:hypothetical protein
VAASKSTFAPLLSIRANSAEGLYKRGAPQRCDRLRGPCHAGAARIIAKAQLLVEGLPRIWPALRDNYRTTAEAFVLVKLTFVRSAGAAGPASDRLIDSDIDARSGTDQTNRQGKGGRVYKGRPSSI